MMGMRGSWFVTASAIHAWWALCLIVDPAAAWVTAIASLVDIGFGRWSLVCLFLGASILVVFEFKRGRYGSPYGFLLMMPQQVLLLLSAVGEVSAIYNSAFADGVVRPRAFIAADQFPMIFITIMHTFALLHYYAGVRAWRSL